MQDSGRRLRSIICMIEAIYCFTDTWDHYTTPPAKAVSPLKGIAVNLRVVL
jgi:hypothetical protein